MATEAQIAANRLNALKSTGPRTERGKRISAMNSRRDWTIAESVVIFQESKTHFMGYLHSYVDHYKPQTPHERDLVETMAVSRWRILRLWGLESCNIAKAVNECPQHEDDDLCTETLRAIQQNEIGNRTQELFSRYEARYDRQYHRAAQALERAIEKRERIEQSKKELPAEKFQEHDEPNYLPQNQGECR